MAVMNTVNLMSAVGGWKSQSQSQSQSPTPSPIVRCLNVSAPTPRSLSSGPPRRFRRRCCCAKSERKTAYSTAPYFTEAFSKLNYNFIALGDRVYDAITWYLFGPGHRQIVCLGVLFADEDALLQKKLGNIISENDKLEDDIDKSPLLLKGLLDCLMENEDSWISSRSLVARSYIQCFDNTAKFWDAWIPFIGSESADLELDVTASSTNFTEFIILASMYGAALDEKRIQTREDLKEFMHQLKSIKVILNATGSSYDFMVPMDINAGIFKGYFSHISV